MGGYGSTRWAWHTAKTQVESCLKLSIKTIKANLRPGWAGVVYWESAGARVADISYRVEGNELGRPSLIRLIYVITNRGSGEKTDLDYPVLLTSTVTSWGSLRYWFVCPLKDCLRRVGVLYLPPGGKYFGCRHCYNLAYRSSQEQHQSDGVYRYMAGMMQADYPGLTPAEARYMMGDHGKPPPAGGYFAQELERRRAAWLADLLAQAGRRYAGYLTAGDLCEQSGLSAGDLARLEAARLLIPDHEGLYRPKLAGWARKLAYLLAAGWELSEVKAWARGRWATDNPRAWPPDQAAWQPQEIPPEKV